MKNDLLDSTNETFGYEQRVGRTNRRDDTIKCYKP